MAETRQIPAMGTLIRPAYMRRDPSWYAIPWQAWLLAALSGVLQVLVFPLPNLSWLCWIAITPLLVAILHARRLGRVPSSVASVRQGFVLGYLSGIIFYLGSCNWIYHVMHVYGGLDGPVAAGILVLFCFYLALVNAAFGALFALAAGRLKLGPRALVLAPFLWVGLELFRSRIIAFPWDLMGTALVDNIPLSRIATITGVYGLSFEILLVNAAFASVFLGRRERRTLVLAGCILLVGILQTGAFFTAPLQPANGTARLVQPNLALDLNWTPAFYEQTLNDLSKLSVPQPGELMPGDPLPDLVIWPESPAPFYENDPRFQQTVDKIAVDSHAYVIAGEIGLGPSANDREVYNSAAIVTPQGRALARYDKVHLVPFGEYVPFKNLFSFAGKLTREVSDFSFGYERMALPVHSYKLSVFICYEAVFPDEVREFAAKGAQVFINISNDGWFGDTGAPEQHLRMARMRAIENDRWILRATNTGISASIDPFGRVVSTLPRHIRVALDVPYGVITGTTFYTRHGDWFAWACAIIATGVFLALILRIRTAKS
ncbi:MAG TPA: apolipoprotein N-acyltransferase [Terriglobales bacterium]|nr:apolipoprotein N-acyltransferase [Terriglobales bacterium]